MPKSLTAMTALIDTFTKEAFQHIPTDEQLRQYLREAQRLHNEQKKRDAIKAYLEEERQQSIDDAEENAKADEEEEKANLTRAIQGTSDRLRLQPPPNSKEAPKINVISKPTPRLDSIYAKIKQIDDRKINYDENMEQAKKFIGNLNGIPDKNQKISALKGRILAIDLIVKKDFERAFMTIDFHEAQNKLEEARAVLIQSGALKDMLSVLEGKKVMCDIEGKPVDSFKDAKFFVPTGQQLIKNDEGYFLLKADQQFENLTPGEKADAQDYFNNSRELVSVQTVIDVNSSIDLTEKTELQKEVESIQAEAAQIYSISALTSPADSSSFQESQDTADPNNPTQSH